MNQKQVTLILPCECSDLAHAVEFSYYEGDPIGVSIVMHLAAHRSWWERVKLAWAFVFRGRAPFLCDSVLGEESTISLWQFLGRIPVENGTTLEALAKR